MSNPLEVVDLSKSLSREESLARIERAQKRLTHLRLFTAGLLRNGEPGPAIVVILEGFDAAGKGGAIRRITSAIDPRHVRVVPVIKPTDEEAAHHFLWRFQSSMPKRGAMTIFDRSWYGRLLVERVENMINMDQVRRSADEIVDFERALVNDETIVIKFWLHISAEEQLSRFLDRQSDPLKNWKLTDDDWHNRELRDEYIKAVKFMLQETDHEHARWQVVPAENKHYARVFIFESLNQSIEKALVSRGYEVPASRGDDYLHKT